MPRRLTLRPREKGRDGRLELYVIYEREGTWEPSWRPLQSHDIATLVTRVSKEQYDQALIGYTKPLMSALGLPPEGGLRKLPVAARECHARGQCSMYAPRECVPTAKEMPSCFTPGGIAEEDVRLLAAEVVRLWREGVYVLVVTEEVRS